jgi:ComEC/Rec2-related protein
VSFNNGGEFHSIYESLACGSRMDNPEFDRIFKDLGLIHYFVVSGFHLIYLESVLNYFDFLKKSQWKISFLLVVFAFSTGFNPPVVRSLVALFLKWHIEKKELRTGAIQQVLISILIVLVLNPSWLTSVSLHLSWAAALALSLRIANPALLLATLYFFIFPILSQFQIAHPLSPLVSFLFGFVFSFLYFPLSFLSHYFSFLSPLGDEIWRITLPFFKTLSTEIHGISPHFRFTLSGVYYLCALHILALSFRVLYLRYYFCLPLKLFARRT